MLHCCEQKNNFLSIYCNSEYEYSSPQTLLDMGSIICEVGDVTCGAAADVARLRQDSNWPGPWKILRVELSTGSPRPVVLFVMR